MEAKKNKREEVDYWIQKSKQSSGSISYKERLIIDFLWTARDSSIEEWAKENGFDGRQISNLLKDKTEELAHFLPEIYKLNNFISGQVEEFFAQIRIYSWFREDYQNAENFRAQPIDWVKEKDESGEPKHISIDTSIARPPGLYNSARNNPEESFRDHEFHLKIMSLLAAIESSGRKNAAAYRKILEMELLEGIHVKPIHATGLGVPEEKIPSLRHQAFELTKKLVRKKYPELIEVINNLKRGTKHIIKKSTRKDRESQRRSNSDDEIKKPGSILIWTRGEGYKTLSYEEAVRLTKPNGSSKKKKPRYQPARRPKEEITPTFP